VCLRHGDYRLQLVVRLCVRKSNLRVARSKSYYYQKLRLKIIGLVPQWYWLYEPSTIQHSNDVCIRISIGITCSDDIHGWYSYYQYANDVGQCTKTNGYLGGSMNLPGIWREIMVFPGIWGENHDPRLGLGLVHGWHHLGLMGDGQTIWLGGPATIGHRSGMT